MSNHAILFKEWTNVVDNGVSYEDKFTYRRYIYNNSSLSDSEILKILDSAYLAENDTFKNEIFYLNKIKITDWKSIPCTHDQVKILTVADSVQHKIIIHICDEYRTINTEEKFVNKYIYKIDTKYKDNSIYTQYFYDSYSVSREYNYLKSHEHNVIHTQERILYTDAIKADKNIKIYKYYRKPMEEGISIGNLRRRRIYGKEQGVIDLDNDIPMPLINRKFPSLFENEIIELDNFSQSDKLRYALRYLYNK